MSVIAQFLARHTEPSHPCGIRKDQTTFISRVLCGGHFGFLNKRAAPSDFCNFGSRLRSSRPSASIKNSKRPPQTQNMRDKVSLIFYQNGCGGSLWLGMTNQSVGFGRRDPQAVLSTHSATLISFQEIFFRLHKVKIS